MEFRILHWSSTFFSPMFVNTKKQISQSRGSRPAHSGFYRRGKDNLLESQAGISKEKKVSVFTHPDKRCKCCELEAATVLSIFQRATRISCNLTGRGAKEFLQWLLIKVKWILSAAIFSHVQIRKALKPNLTNDAPRFEQKFTRKVELWQRGRAWTLLLYRVGGIRTHRRMFLPLT